VTPGGGSHHRQPANSGSEQLPPAAYRCTATPQADTVRLNWLGSSVGLAGSPPTAPTDPPASVATEAPTTAVQPTPVPSTPVHDACSTAVPATAPLRHRRRRPSPCSPGQEMFADHNAACQQQLRGAYARHATRRSPGAPRTWPTSTSPTHRPRVRRRSPSSIGLRVSAGENIARNYLMPVRAGGDDRLRERPQPPRERRSGFRRVGIGAAFGADGVVLAVVFSNNAYLRNAEGAISASLVPIARERLSARRSNQASANRQYSAGLSSNRIPRLRRLALGHQLPGALAPVTAEGHRRGPLAAFCRLL
jgi:hypothetical protein